ncbi:hypothetical protein [Bacillus sp. FJAT-18017]|nr:hypothetical protein [Bacillus sp. FJAT-18017]
MDKKNITVLEHDEVLVDLLTQLTDRNTNVLIKKSMRNSFGSIKKLTSD